MSVFWFLILAIIAGSLLVIYTGFAIALWRPILSMAAVGGLLYVAFTTNPTAIFATIAVVLVCLFVVAVIYCWTRDIIRWCRRRGWNDIPDLRATACFTGLAIVVIIGLGAAAIETATRQEVTLQTAPQPVPQHTEQN
jgi:hypothetical protein